MKHDTPIPVVDLFAGPGGLGEGFSALGKGKEFRILVSAEMEASAHQTLRLRAFYRILRNKGRNALASYYRYCNGEAENPWDENNHDAWVEAGNEARRLTLGTDKDNIELNSILSKARLNDSEPWVLIGGPPCQAYSLVGRARNKGKSDYRAEDDHRHFLYREYLKIIQRYRPTVFVMENVKGILSSKVKDQKIFHTILQDLSDPDSTFGKKSALGYRIHSLVTPTVFERGMSPDQINARDFIIRAEEYGIPQARHRVILLGIREDIETTPESLKKANITSVWDAISELPPLRSRISKRKDSSEEWYSIVRQHLAELYQATYQKHELHKLGETLANLHSAMINDLDSGALRLRTYNQSHLPDNKLGRWYHDEHLRVWLNHEARSHMPSDLRRYLYASSYSKTYDLSPKGHAAFDLPGLRPDHKNWESGKFADRFKVQLGNRPATTITSHISKDGHYFIHPDPAQCRSLTVREAARLQTFPDNYFFQGNRTQQFHQVGNAVPPLLANKIAELVRSLLP